MKSLGTASTDEAALSEIPLKLGVLLVYEDFAAGLRARQALDHWSRQLELEADLHIDLWRFDLLRDPDCRAQAAKEAAAADIILFAAHGQSELTAEVKAWLQQWLDWKAQQPTALIVSLDARVREWPGGNPVLNQVAGLVRNAGVDLFAHYGASANPGREITFESIGQRAHTTSVLLDEILHQHVMYPRWGLKGLDLR